MWAQRLSLLSDTISPEQKGFCRVDGTGEHIAALKTVVHQVVNNFQNMTVAWLDLTNAFGSVPHAVMQKAIKALGFPKRFCKIVRDLYEESFTAVKANGEKTGEIEIEAGTKQGDPISPLLFNLCMEPIIRAFKKRFPDALQVQGYPVSILAYADDLVIVARSPEEMEEMLAFIVSEAAKIGLTFNTKKCATLSLEKGRVAEDSFKINGEKITALQETESYEYLGIEIGRHVSTDLTGKAKRILENLKKNSGQ